MSSREDIAWAAGLFEGEGTIWFSWGTPKYPWPSNALRVSSTDRDVLQRFQDIVNCGEIYEDKRYPKKNGELGKACYTWHVGKRETVCQVLKLLMSWFGQRRKAKAEECLTFLEEAQQRKVA